MPAPETTLEYDSSQRAIKQRTRILERLDRETMKRGTHCTVAIEYDIKDGYIVGEFRPAIRGRERVEGAS